MHLLACAALLAAPTTAVDAGPVCQDPNRPGPSLPASDILATAGEAGSFATLLTAVRAAGLQEVLRSEGPFTVFAPTDDAFAALPEALMADLLRPESRERLAAVLRHHVAPGRFTAAAALAAGSAATLAGDRLEIRLDRGRLAVGGARVLQNDIETANGVIHAIDTVLIPRDALAESPVALSSTGLIELAIDRGVPLFNAGQQAACTAIYEVAARSLLAHSEPPLPAPVRRALEQAARSRGDNDAVAQAWRLRQALDAAYAALTRAQPAARATAEVPEAPEVGVVVDDFDGGEVESWRAVNDTVMGGRSRSAIKVGSDGAAVFAGTVSLENNGGFASVRRRVERGSLAGLTGIEIRVRGDGKGYAFNVSDRGEVTPDLYRTEFATEAGEWTEVRLPFAAMERSVMGFRPPNATPIEPARIASLGLSIGDKQDGPFELEIDWIRGYRGR